MARDGARGRGGAGAAPAGSGAERCRIAGVEAWIFDLDNTLYPPEAGLLGQIDRLMTDFIMRFLKVSEAEADRMRAHYWERDGITLHGLMEDHGVEAAAFLEETHAVDLSGLGPDPALTAAVAGLPGRKVIHTNGARRHAERVLAARGLAGAFERIFAIEDKNYVPKPERPAYLHVIREAGIDPARAAMIEDTVVNLVEPKRLGMTTVWLDHRDAGGEHPHVDARIGDLTRFLEAQAAG
ncbi:pyrimidine 5'-nucleotidase [Paralimibaculum aggregatum]|uniref:Pyrimidine 5'-nucleotidase n=1 Tax=Paralimibaculum aggregatum TaxID=3036245 RepID=A0ABQ6LEX8_9RHOB|nr:pyrimidine 5'-nucleotidase [Limibaculum sp. NKW23]GMG81900.1 pyrimidine 5'-nucleotidase [Limibaculum sp. NKW23]